MTVKLFATLREGRFAMDTLELQSGATVDGVIRHLSISGKEAALILLNSRHATLSTELADGDTLAIFPPVGGG